MRGGNHILSRAVEIYFFIILHLSKKIYAEILFGFKTYKVYDWKNCLDSWWKVAKWMSVWTSTCQSRQSLRCLCGCPMRCPSSSLYILPVRKIVY